MHAHPTQAPATHLSPPSPTYQPASLPSPISHPTNHTQITHLPSLTPSPKMRLKTTTWSPRRLFLRGLKNRSMTAVLCLCVMVWSAQTILDIPISHRNPIPRALSSHLTHVFASNREFTRPRPARSGLCRPSAGDADSPGWGERGDGPSDGLAGGLGT